MRKEREDRAVEGSPRQKESKFLKETKATTVTNKSPPKSAPDIRQRQTKKGDERRQTTHSPSNHFILTKPPKTPNINQTITPPSIGQTAVKQLLS
mmetsp:Transcript_3373/g.6978  ORF Transcript_3373/g.6978 Transcript_3373/m.6978 type:complete len:95 (-) Transcript_3373:45-329(-)